MTSITYIGGGQIKHFKKKKDVQFHLYPQECMIGGLWCEDNGRCLTFFLFLLSVKRIFLVIVVDMVNKRLLVALYFCLICILILLVKSCKK